MKESLEFEGYRKLIWHGKKRNYPATRLHAHPGRSQEPESKTEEEQPAKKPRTKQTRRGSRPQPRRA